VQAVSSSPLAAESVREFIAERIRPPQAGQPRSHEWQVRQALIGSQLMGLAFQRYIMGTQPVATADPDQLAAWVGPVIDRYLHEPLPGLALPGLALPGLALPGLALDGDRRGGRGGRGGGAVPVRAGHRS